MVIETVVIVSSAIGFIMLLFAGWSITEGAV